MKRVALARMASPSKRPDMRAEQRKAIAGRKRRLAIERDQHTKADITAWPSIGRPRAKR